MNCSQITTDETIILFLNKSIFTHSITESITFENYIVRPKKPEKSSSEMAELSSIIIEGSKSSNYVNMVMLFWKTETG
jgi:hypothetical protein